MAFQEIVNILPGKGAPGQEYGLTDYQTFLPNPIASESVICGIACFVDPATNKVSNGTTGTPTDASGIVMRNMVETLPSDQSAINYYAENKVVPVMTKGTILVVATAAVTAGQEIYAKISDGTLIGSTPGTTPENYAKTGFFAKESAAIGDVFVAQKS